jgi:hypothetical protein
MGKRKKKKKKKKMYSNREGCGNEEENKLCNTGL